MSATKTHALVPNQWENEEGTQTGDPPDVVLASHPDIAGEPRYVGGDECYRCHFTYPRDRLVYYEGRPYCTDRGCYDDVEFFRRSRVGGGPRGAASIRPAEG